MKKLAKLWDIQFIGGIGFFLMSVAWADQVAVPLVVLSFNAGIWLAQWLANLQLARCYEAMAAGRALVDSQTKLIDALRKQIEGGKD